MESSRVGVLLPAHLEWWRGGEWVGNMVEGRRGRKPSNPYCSFRRELWAWEEREMKAGRTPANTPINTRDLGLESKQKGKKGVLLWVSK